MRREFGVEYFLDTEMTPATRRWSPLPTCSLFRRSFQPFVYRLLRRDRALEATRSHFYLRTYLLPRDAVELVDAKSAENDRSPVRRCFRIWTWLDGCAFARVFAWKRQHQQGRTTY